MKKESYIKKHNPEMYKFFMDFWKLVSQYWEADTSNEYFYNCLTSDMLYYTRKYDGNFFFANMLFSVYDHCYSVTNDETTMEQLKKFLGDLWEYMNSTYEISEAGEGSGSKVIELTDRIRKSYTDDFSNKLINHYVSWKFPDLLPVV